MEANLDKINWEWLSRNPNSIHILEKNLDKIEWKELSTNPNAIHLLKANQDKICWKFLSSNTNIFEPDTKYNNTKSLKKANELDNYINDYSKLSHIVDTFHSVRSYTKSNINNSCVLS